MLGVLVSLVNLDLKSKYSIFEIGTNNFNEIRKSLGIPGVYERTARLILLKIKN